ncbi:HEAT repeat-containing protein [Thermomonospora echinospora]|uniref:HEAT repeat-containing protein n=1 Tax=Thermomonospora echinospora TaxID=1992 RepID=A0A1H6D6M2_9ACTN|nr:HEAT repeat domain-containing protein [Thermomonospora echinospora]SEG80734.1 HEAT repeat-containing protein [Thermomonospora echinospora]
MSKIIDYGRFAERLARVMPRWDERERMPQAEFAAHLADTGPRWELLREFQQEWGYEPPGGAPSWPRWSEDAHKEYLRRLKAEATGEEEDDEFAGVDLALPIPRALDEWWDLPFNSFTYQPRLYWTNPEWPPTVRPDPSGYGVSEGLPEDNPFVGPGEDLRVCVFKAEYQYCNEWGYPAAEAHLADPRVLVSTEDGWVVQSGSISEFFLHLALERLPPHFGWTLEFTYGDLKEDPGLVERVRAAYPEMGLRPWRELAQEAYTYGAPDAIIRHDVGEGDYPLRVFGRNRAALEQVVRTLGVEPTEEMFSPPYYEGAWLDLAPITLAVGDADDEGRWKVRESRTQPPVTLPDGPAPLGRPVETPVAGPGDPAEMSDGPEAIGPGGPVRAADDSHDLVTAVGRDGGLLAAGGRDGGVRVWWDGDERGHALHNGPVTALACFNVPGGAPVVLSGDERGALRLWDVRREPLARQYARRAAPVVAVAAGKPPTGLAFAAAWADGLVRLWDVDSGESADLKLGTGIGALELGDDGTLTVGGGHGTVVLELSPQRLWPRRDLVLRLEETDWDGLEAAEGTAGELPDEILTVAFGREREAEEALRKVRRAIHRPGAAFPATAPAAAVLLDVAAGPACQVRVSVLSLLSNVADVLTDDEMPTGESAVRRLAQATFEAVEARVPMLLGLLDDPDPLVRGAVAVVLSSFPGHRPPLVPVLRERVAGETDPGAAGAMVICVGVLARDSGEPVVEWLTGLLAEEHSHEVRIAAALALLELDLEEYPDGLAPAIAEAGRESALDAQLWTGSKSGAELLYSMMSIRLPAQVDFVRFGLAAPGVSTVVRTVEHAGLSMRRWRAAPERMLPLLAELLHEEEPQIRAAAVTEISKAGPAVAAMADALVPLLGDEDETVAAGALEALARVGDSRCLPVLIGSGMRRCSEYAVAGMAAHATELLPHLRAFLGASSGAGPGADLGAAGHEDARLTAVLHGLRHWNVAPLLPELLGLLERGVAVADVASLLAGLGAAASDAVPALRARLDDDIPQIRRDAAWALWWITGDAGEPLRVLGPCLSETLDDTTAQRLFDLGTAAAPAAPLVEPLLEDERTAGAAACVLYRSTGDTERTLPHLTAAVAATPVGMLAIRCLTEIGSPAAATIPALQRIAGSAYVQATAPEDDLIATDLTYRDLAATALARVTGP